MIFCDCCLSRTLCSFIKFSNSYETSRDCTATSSLFDMVLALSITFAIAIIPVAYCPESCFGSYVSYSRTSISIFLSFLFLMLISGESNSTKCSYSSLWLASSTGHEIKKLFAFIFLRSPAISSTSSCFFYSVVMPSDSAKSDSSCAALFATSS